MADVCLRNMSCTCRLCAGEDIAALVNITKSISSNIAYDDGEEHDGDDDAPPPPVMNVGRMTNSPPIPTARKSALPARQPPSTATAAAPAAAAAPPAVTQRKSALPTQRKSALPARRPLLAKRAPVALPADDGDVMMDDSAAVPVPVAAAPSLPSRPTAPAPMAVDSDSITAAPAAAPPVAARPAPAAGNDVCSRNMSCRCSLCAGEDTAALKSLTKSIASTITYDDDGDETADRENEQPPVPATAGRMTNSPPIPTARKSALPTREPPPATTAAAPPALAQRRSALPTQRKSALPSRPSAPVDVPMAVDSDASASLPPPPPAAAAVAPPVAVRPKPAAGNDVCLRNMSCRCSLCAGEDTAALMTLTKSIASTITYNDSDVEHMDNDSSSSHASLPPPPTLGRMTNSPSVPTVRKTIVSPAPPPPAPAAANAPNAAVADTSADTADWSVDEIVAKLSDKNWKLRKEANEHVKRHCERSGVRHDDVEPFVEFFSKMCDDANAMAMETGVHAVLAYAVHVVPFQKSIVPSVMKKLTDKGFSSRPSVVKSCEDVVQAFIQAGAADDTVHALIEGTKNKKPKVPPACCANLLDALKAFGPRVVPLPALKAALPTLCESTVNGVRPIALNIVAEIHRWTGPALVQDIVANLRQAQQTEYEALTKDMVLGQAAPTKFVRGAAPAAAGGKRGSGTAAAGSGAGSASAAGAGASSVFDPREFAETVDLLAKLPRTEFKAKLALPKWSAKVDALKIVLELIGPVPKLANGDYYELVNTLKILSNDANVNIVAKSIEVLGALADGLRKQFTQYARMMFPELVRKLSDKKSVVLNATNNALDLFLQHAMTIDMMLDELKLALDATKNKAPQARVQTIGFLTRCVDKSFVNRSDKSLMLDFGAQFAAAMDDTDPTVRKAGLDALIALLKASDQIAEWLQPLVDDVARKNPRSYKTIQQSVGSGGGARAAVKATPAAAAVARKVDTVDIDAAIATANAVAAAVRPGMKKPPAKALASRLAAGKTAGGTDATSKPTTAASAASRKPPAGGGSSSASTGGDFVPMSISVASEDARAIVAELDIEDWSAIEEGFASTQWMARKTAIEQLEAFARAHSSALTMRVIEALTLFVSKHVKDFKDSNVNVVKSAFEAVGTFAEHATSKFPRGVVCHVVPSAADKISDRKASEAIRLMLLQFCEAVGPAYVLGCLLDYMPSVKAPLVHTEVLSVLADCVKDFGVAVCSPRLLIDFVKGAQGLESSNPKVRTSAIALLAAMYAQLGPALLPILALDTWKPALAALVDAEFKKTGFDAASAMATVKRHVKDDGDGSGSGAKALDAGALFGRVDISSQLTKELFADMKCEEDMAAWKKRAAAMDAVQSICEASGGAIEFTKAVQEVLKALKARLSDSNANLKVKAAQVIGVVASCVGADIARVSKFLGPTLVGGVADNKKTMQTAAVDALHKWVRHNNATSQACVESLLAAVSEGLLNPVGRAELLGWAAEHLPHCSNRLDLTCLIVPTVQCLMDKSSEAREKAQLVLAQVIRSVGQEPVLTTGCRDIKPAQMRTLRPLIQKVCDSVNESAAATVATPAAAAAAAAPQLPPVVPGTPTRTGPGGARLVRAGSVPSKPGVSVRPALVRPGSFRAPSGDAASDTSEDGSDAPMPASSAAAAAPSTTMLKMNATKSARLAKGQYNKWLFEATAVSEMAARKSELEAEWRPFLAPELHAKLFAPSLEKGMLAAVTDLMTCATRQPNELIAALDLVLKWCTLRLVDNNVQALAKVLDLLVKLFEVLKSRQYELDDVEAAIFLPYLLQESGQSKPRFRVRFRDIMKLVADVYSREKYVAYLIECMNGSKNMRSRCECIDLVEYLVSLHTGGGGGIQSLGLGKKVVKEVAKFVTAHEKELRESAISALVAVFTRTSTDNGRDVDKFYRLAGVTTQQGVDLLNARIKHLPAGSFASASAQQQQQQPLRPASPGVLPPPGRTSALTPPRMPTSSFANGFAAAHTNATASIAAPRQQQHLDHDDDDGDAHMMALSIQDDAMGAANDADALDDDVVDTVEAFLLQPIDCLLTDTNAIVDEHSQLYVDGLDALKGLYAIIDRPECDSERTFVCFYVNDIALKLCDLIHASFGGNSSTAETSPLARHEQHVLSVSLSALKLLLTRHRDATERLQRYAVERIVLELCSKLLDPRIEAFASTDAPAQSIASLSSDKRVHWRLSKGLTQALTHVTQHIKPGEVVPAVINLLQRIVRNDVGDYNARDAYRHLMQRDSLDQIVGRLLLLLTGEQTQSQSQQFDGIDLFGVLMQMHSFFSTLPQTTDDLFVVQIATDNMHKALHAIASSVLSTSAERRSSFEAALRDLPVPSPVRELLAAMGLTGTVTTGGQDDDSATVATAGETVATSDSVTRTLFPVASSSAATNGSAAMRTRPSVRSNSVTGATLDAAVASIATSSTRASFPSFNEFTTSRTVAASTDRRSSASITGVNGAPITMTTSTSASNGSSVSNSVSATSSTTQLLRERLERVRKF